MWRVTLPLVTPGVLGAAIFVFAEMLGSFSAALVLGTPVRFYVITTAIYQLVAQYPPRIPLAAAMGVSLFAVMFAMLFVYRRIIARRSYVTVSGKAFRPRLTDVGGLRWVLFAICASYVLLSVVLPILTLVYASIQRLAVAFPAAANFTLDNYRAALSQNAVRYATWNSLLLGVATATIGVALTGMLSWLIHRSRVPGRGVLEYIVMFPQAVPRLVFAFGMMWAWLVFPIPIYGTLWLLLIAYLTVFLPLGVRTISSVLLQLDKSLEECGEVCGASLGLPHAHHHHAVAAARPAGGLDAAVHRQRARTGRFDPADGPALPGADPGHRQRLVRQQFGADGGDGADTDGCPGRGGGGVHADHAPRRPAWRLTTGNASAAHIEVEDLEIHYGPVAAVGPVSFTVMPGQQVTLLGPSGCGKTTTLRAIAGLERPTAGTIRISGADDVFVGATASTCRPKSAACRWCSSPTRSGRT